MTSKNSKFEEMTFGLLDSWTFGLLDFQTYSARTDGGSGKRLAWTPSHQEV